MARPLLRLECPKKDTNMNDFVNEYFNEPNPVTNWRHEDGCGRRTEGNNFQRLKNIDNQEFFILLVTRLKGEPLTIDRTKLEVTPTIDIKKTENSSVKFKPIAVIHHDGYVHGNDTRGHYMADILDHSSNQWLRTSDDAEPRSINSVSNQGYIFLYKKV